MIFLFIIMVCFAALAVVVSPWFWLAVIVVSLARTRQRTVKVVIRQRK